MGRIQAAHRQPRSGRVAGSHPPPLVPSRDKCLRDDLEEVSRIAASRNSNGLRFEGAEIFGENFADRFRGKNRKTEDAERRKIIFGVLRGRQASKMLATLGWSAHTYRPLLKGSPRIKHRTCIKNVGFGVRSGWERCRTFRAVSLAGGLGAVRRGRRAVSCLRRCTRLRAREFPLRRSLACAARASGVPVLLGRVPGPTCFGKSDQSSQRGPIGWAIADASMRPGGVSVSVQTRTRRRPEKRMRMRSTKESSTMQSM